MNASKHRLDVEQLARVFWIHLLDVCSSFARSCKQGITVRTLDLRSWGRGFDFWWSHR